MTARNFLEGVNSWQLYWENYNSLLNRLESSGQPQIATGLKIAKQRHLGFTEGWYNFLEGAKSVRNSNPQLKGTEEGEWLDQLIAFVECALNHRS